MQTYATRYINSDWCFRLPFLLQIVPGKSDHNDCPAVNKASYEMLFRQLSFSVQRFISCHTLLESWPVNPRTNNSSTCSFNSETYLSVTLAFRLNGSQLELKLCIIGKHFWNAILRWVVLG